MNLYAVTCKVPNDDRGDQPWLQYRGDYQGTELDKWGEVQLMLGRVALALGAKDVKGIPTDTFSVELILAESIPDALKTLDQSVGVYYGSQDVVEIKLLSSFILCQRYDSIVVSKDGWIEGE